MRKQALDNDVPHTTLQHRVGGRQSRKDKDDGQLYLYPWEEKALAKLLAHQDALGRSVRVGYIRSIAFGSESQAVGQVILRAEAGHRPFMNAILNLPRANSKRWIGGGSTYDKIVPWFEVIGPVLQRSDILPCNVWNYDETGTLISMPKAVKVVVSKRNKRGRKGARIKRTNITAIECVNADSRYLNLMDNLAGVNP